MIEFIVTIITALIITFFMLYIIEDLLGNKRKPNLKKFIIPYLILSVITFLEYTYFNKALGIMVLCAAFFLYIKFVYKQNIQKSILTTIFYQLVVMISEMLFSIITISILKLNIQVLLLNPIYLILINFVISLLNVGMVKIPFIKRFYSYLIKITDKINSKQLVFFSIILVLIANLLTGFLYYKVEFIYILIFNTLIALFCFFVVVYNFNTQNKYIKVYDKYNTTLNSIKEYEDILDKYRVSSHENKNELLTIRNMLPKTNKKLISYIDEILDNKLKDDGDAIYETSKIPAGGLRGLIYSKILAMKESEITYKLQISNDIKTIDLINIDDSLMLDICKVVGVYLDNSIQAVETLTSKQILIEFYLENKDLVIAVSNNYNGTIELEKLEKKGYSSKGEGHGYGLALAKDIINKNKKLLNEKKLSKKTFSQILKIKM